MAGTEIRVLLVEDNLDDARLVRDMLGAAEGFTFHVHCVESLLGGLDALTHNEFDIALLDLSLPDSQGLATFETVHRQAVGLPIVILTGISSEQLALNAVQGGAQDYLVKGRLNSQALIRVLQYSLMRRQNMAQAAPAEPAGAAVIGILSAKGGVGGTTVAAHISVELKRQSLGNVLLVDLDASAASSAFLMKPDSRYSALDAATNLHRLDAGFWNGVVGKTPHGVDLLQSPGALRFSEPLNGERVRHVLRFARSLYSTIVVDLGRLNQQSMNLLAETKELYLVCTAGLPEIYETGRVLKKLMELGLSRDRVRVIFNRMARAGQPNMGAFEQALGYPVYWVIPDLTREVEEDYAEGRFLTERSALGKQMARLVAKSLGVEDHKPSGGLFGMFWPLRNRSAA